MAKNTMMVYALSLVLLLAVVYYFKPSLFNFMKLNQRFVDLDGDGDDDDNVSGFVDADGDGDDDDLE